MARKSLFLLLGILILGFVIRVYKFTSLPMYGDELTMVYDTYSILKTGKDSTGESFPLTFKMGAGRPGGYIYASIPFVYLFGPTEWGVRSLSLLSGLGIIVLMYFLGKKLFTEKVGLMASFLTAISLWDVYLSRGGFEAHFALLLALLGIVGFLYKKYFLWAISWGIAIFTYPTFKLTLPLSFLLLIWYIGLKNLIKSKVFIISLIVLALFGGLAIKETIKGRSEARFLEINILSDIGLRQSLIQKVSEERTISKLPNLAKPIFYNRPIEYSRILLESYMDNLSPRFLYLRGDGNPRHNPGEWGMLYLVELPLLFVGLGLMRKENKKEMILILTSILIVPLATMFLGQTHALRNDLMLPFFILISSYALTKISKKFVYVSFVLIAIQLIFVLNAIYFYAPSKFGSFWSSDAKEASLKAIKNNDRSGKYFLSARIDNIEFAYPVYAKIDPKMVIEQYGRYPKVYGNVVIADTIELK